VIAGRVAAAVIALAVLARALVRYRRGRIGRGKVAAWTALAAALAVYAAGVLSPLPSPERILGGLAGAIGPYAYLLVGALAYLETAAFLGLITPGELTMLLGGVVAARGDVSIVPLVGLVWLCSVLGARCSGTRPDTCSDGGSGAPSSCVTAIASISAPSGSSAWRASSIAVVGRPS
jgi:hypothetical protein